MQMEMFGAAEYYDPAYLNPMVVQYGKGKEFVKCKTCSHLVRVEHGDKKYVKCKMRGITHGAGTDHLVSYAACKLYQEGET